MRDKCVAVYGLGVSRVTAGIENAENAPGCGLRFILGERFCPLSCRTTKNGYAYGEGEFLKLLYFPCASTNMTIWSVFFMDEGDFWSPLNTEPHIPYS